MQSRHGIKWHPASHHHNNLPSTMAAIGVNRSLVNTASDKSQETHLASQPYACRVSMHAPQAHFPPTHGRRSSLELMSEIPSRMKCRHAHTRGRVYSITAATGASTYVHICLMVVGASGAYSQSFESSRRRVPCPAVAPVLGCTFATAPHYYDA